MNSYSRYLQEKSIEKVKKNRHKRLKSSYKIITREKWEENRGDERMT